MLIDEVIIIIAKVAVHSNRTVKMMTILCYTQLFSYIEQPM